MYKDKSITELLLCLENAMFDSCRSSYFDDSVGLEDYKTQRDEIKAEILSRFKKEN